jgi:hypothetical protein
MKVSYPEQVESPEDRAFLEQATNLLEKTMGTTSSGMANINSTDDVTATWSMQKQHGRTIYVLTLSDPTSEVRTEFLPSDLKYPSQARFLPFNMARLWGDLLEKRSHKQLEKLWQGGHQ